MKQLVKAFSAALLLALLVPADAAQTSASSYARDLAAPCMTCHGTGGNSVGNVPPALAGRPRTEILQMMLDFKVGKRPATIMHQQAKGYTDEQLALVAEYFAAQRRAPAPVPPKP
jgi:cytochrome subunit of sulfide dehydrogenase